MTTFEELSPGESGLLSARPGPDLTAAGYVEREYVVTGAALSYRGATPPIILVIAAAASRTSGPSAPSRSGVTRTVGPEIEMPPIGSANSLKIAAATQRMPG